MLLIWKYKQNLFNFEIKAEFILHLNVELKADLVCHLHLFPANNGFPPANHQSRVK